MSLVLRSRLLTLGIPTAQSRLLLDTTHDIATPEGVELKLPVAGLAARSLAWLIDAMIKLIVASFGSTAFLVFGGAGVGLMLLLAFTLLWLYNVLFEVFLNGATPGKKALGVRVVNLNGTPVGWSGSTIRNLLRFIDLLPGTYLLGLLSVSLSARFQRLGDLAAGTIVVYDTAVVPPMRAGADKPLPITVPLSAVEQQAIVSYAERAPRMNDERVAELASLLEPVLGQVDSDTLKRHASWIAGSGQ